MRPATYFAVLVALLVTPRVVSIGHSSGGHLALWVAGRRRIPQGTELCDDDN
ncbi:MAG: hypothetical protein KAJ42_10090 [Gemmatimonadetes bacterium]|nr:hypothetical protein [Gemmatimonadota bacterium]